MSKNIDRMDSISILLVDDNPEICHTMKDFLSILFKKVLTAEDGVRALQRYKKESFDLVITDIAMPEMDGLTLVKKIREIDSKQSIVILSAHGDSDSLLEAIELNVDGFILKPFTKDHFQSTLERVCENIYRKKELRRYQNELEIMVEDKSKKLIELNNEIEETLKYTLYTLTEIAEARSKETGNHIRRVAEYSSIFCKNLELPCRDAELLKLGATMHDIGKIVIPDEIIHKPGSLSRAEFDLMKSHSLIGYEMLKNSNREIFQMAAIIALNHHEKWNGEGYPNGLSRSDIPLEGRVVALADVFDALSVKRAYKEAWELDRVFEYIKSEREVSFDPMMVDIFFENIDSFVEIKNRYAD